jgi:2-polyprenyl-3-methyl-5-hydroxy-6-metoxy-1,4-benzoquinol methylase
VNTWPPKDLEIIDSCPVCFSSNKSLLFQELKDKIFFTAQGSWKMWQCEECLSGFISPRPDRNSIHLAYAEYYTHSGPTIQQKYSELSFLKKLRRQLTNGYINIRYGAKFYPSARLGYFLCKIFPFLKTTIDLRFRNLPLRHHKSPKLLDIGCGSGTFLVDSSFCNWEAVGIDIDSSAVEKCKKHGLSVMHGDLDIFREKSNEFDCITMDHVIEHLHDPLEELKKCFVLLKNGGQIWIQTPNINSYGLSRFGQDWRGLEPPRHLVIFNKSSIKKALKKAGFKNIQFLNSPDPSSRTFAASYAISLDIPPYSNFKIPLKIWFHSFTNKLITKIFADKSEFITVIARKDI